MQIKLGQGERVRYMDRHAEKKKATRQKNGKKVSFKQF
jgi:hypothetical protein